MPLLLDFQGLSLAFNHPGNIQSRVPGDQGPTTEFTDTHRKENSDQPCLSVSFRSTNVQNLRGVRRFPNA
jgi:hypothetical protein